MARGLRYVDAVKLLDGAGPAAKAVDDLLGGVLSLATAGGSDVALSLFDAKTEMVRLGHAVAGKIHETVRGLARHDRSSRLQAAHGVLVVAAYNAGRPDHRPLPAEVFDRFPDFCEQPLLLLMLALYDAATHGLQNESSLGTAELYERLLSSFAEREVRRLHPREPEAAVPGLVEEELVRLSVVAFAMFNRLRQPVTERELDADLAALGITPDRPGRTEAFRRPLTAGEELIGRFFFIQRSRALQDDRTVQAYEFLHATFGEFLVARLVVRALRDTAARSAVARLPLGGGPRDDGLVQTLLGYMALGARATVLPFVSSLLAGEDRVAIRAWLVDALRAALIRPAYPPREYRPLDKREMLAADRELAARVGRAMGQ